MGEQERKTIQDTFAWYPDNSSKIFPIDYSYREFAQAIGKDYRTVKKYLELETDVSLKDPLNKLYHERANEKKNKPDKLSTEKTKAKHVSIPLEASVFLSYYFQLAQSKEFRKEFYTEEIKITEERKEKFLHDLCRKLCRYFSSSEHSDVEDPQRIFYRHRLLQDTTFAHMAIENLWEDQIRPRYEKLQNLIKSSSAEDLIAPISNLLFTLDSITTNLSTLDKSKDSDKKTEGEKKEDHDDTIEKMLQSLLIYRAPREAAPGEVPFYRIQNTPVKSQTGPSNMQQAFAILRSPKMRTDVLMKETRRSYMSGLVKQVEKDSDLSFEQAYEKCLSYLSTEKTAQTGYLEDLILERCKQYWGSLFDYCTADFKYEYSPTEESEYDDYLTYQVDRLIGQKMGAVTKENASPFNESYKAASSYKTLVQYALPERLTIKRGSETQGKLYEANVSPEELKEREDSYRESAEQLARTANGLWKRIGKSDNLLFSEDTLQLQIEFDKLQEKVAGAAKFFSREPPFSSADEMKMAIQLYYNAADENQSDPIKAYQLEKFNHFAYKFLYGLIMLMLKNDIEEAVPEIRNQALKRLNYSSTK